jgi:hypothetical protein
MPQLTTISNNQNIIHQYEWMRLSYHCEATFTISRTFPLYWLGLTSFPLISCNHSSLQFISETKINQTNKHFLLISLKISMQEIWNQIHSLILLPVTVIKIIQIYKSDSIKVIKIRGLMKQITNIQFSKLSYQTIIQFSEKTPSVTNWNRNKSNQIEKQ